MRILADGYVVRELGLESINALANLHRGSFANRWGAHDFALFLQNSDVITLGAYPPAKTEPAAFLLVRRVADEAEVITIAVDRRHRRRGLARSMLDVAIDLLDEAGVTALHLEVDEQNSAAVDLYRDLGFEVVGVRHAYYPSSKNKPAANALMMALEI